MQAVVSGAEATHNRYYVKDMEAPFHRSAIARRSPRGVIDKRAQSFLRRSRGRCVPMGMRNPDAANLS